MIHVVQTRNFVSKVHAHQIHTAEDHDQQAAVGHSPCDADDGADYLLSEDVAAAVGDSAVPAHDVTQKQWRKGATYTSPPPSCSSGRLHVWGVGCGEKHVQSIGRHLLVNLANIRGVGKETHADGA